jgi:hypothetical protein
LGPNIHSSCEIITSIMNSRLLEFIMNPRFSSSKHRKNASLHRRYGSKRRSFDTCAFSCRIIARIDAGPCAGGGGACEPSGGACDAPAGSCVSRHTRR